MDYFCVVFGAALLELMIHSSAVVVLRSPEFKVHTFSSKDASFGPALPIRGLWGHIFHVNPIYACGTVKHAPPSNETEWIALISRNNCTFVEKILHVQNAGYAGAIVYNVDSDDLIPMAGGHGEHDVRIPSVFIGESSAAVIMHYNASENATVGLISNLDPGMAIYFLIPFVVVIGLCVLALSTFLIVRCAVDYRRKLKTRLPPKKLKRLPIKKFKKGADLDVCAVCLDEYEEDDRLRVLPCGHEYHQKCIDPWLTKSRRTCPLCKRKVFPSDDSDSEAESNQNSGAGISGDQSSSERTPLLLPSGRRHGYTRTRPQQQVEQERAARARLNDGSSDSDDEPLAGPVHNQHQSSVEVHPYPRELLINVDDTHSINVDNAHSINVDSASISSDPSVLRSVPSSRVTGWENQTAEEEGAVGGVPAEEMSATVITEARRKKKEKKRALKTREPDLTRGTANSGLDVDDDHFAAASAMSPSGVASDAVVPPSSGAASAGNMVNENSARHSRYDDGVREEKSRHEKQKSKNRLRKKADDSVSVEVKDAQQRRRGNDDDNDDDDDDEGGFGNGGRNAHDNNAALV